MVARAQGVGPKLAARIVNELKDKAGALPSATGAAVAAVLVPAMPAVPDIALAAAVHWLLWQFSVLLAFVWMVVVLYHTVGFRQFSHHFTGIRDALEAGDEAAARQALARWQRVEVNQIARDTKSAVATTGFELVNGSQTSAQVTAAMQFEKSLGRIMRLMRQVGRIPDKERLLLLLGSSDEIVDRLHGLAGSAPVGIKVNQHWHARTIDDLVK